MSGQSFVSPLPLAPNLFGDDHNGETDDPMYIDPARRVFPSDQNGQVQDEHQDSISPKEKAGENSTPPQDQKITAAHLERRGFKIEAFDLV
jgi:hypothetical protein